MLILNEENSKLRGTKHQLPHYIVDLLKNILTKYPQYSSCSGYKKSLHAVENNGLVTMEWLKSLKNFFTKHTDGRDIEYVLCGGGPVKTFIETKLNQLTASTPKKRKEHTNSATKISVGASSLIGMHGEKQSSKLDMSSSIINNIMPKI